MRYPLLVLDHDDTAVESSRFIHYPCMLENLRAFGRGDDLCYETFMQMNYRWDFVTLLKEAYGFTEQECRAEHEMWKEYLRHHCAPFFPGMGAVISAFRRAGGHLAVVSLAPRDAILRDYAAAGLAPPDLLFAFDGQRRERNKPAPYALEQALAYFHLAPAQALVVDDLPQGLQMARAVGVPFATAGWGHAVQGIRDAMRAEGVPYLARVEDLRALLMEKEN